jgi:hypothetical protein
MIDPPAELPALERLGKRLRHLGQTCGLILHHRGLPPAVVVGPDLPSRRTTLYKVCRALRLELTNRPRPADRVVLYLRFEDVTEKQTQLPAHLPAGAWNARCTDIRKSTLDRHHEAVFGYGLAVDPLRHIGPLLEKGDGNALHDGRILPGPLPPDAVRADKVYQRVIANRVADGRPVDLRLVWLAGSTPIAYLKFKPEELRFTNETTTVETAMPSEIFSAEELRNIALLMERMGVDWAELDILRDANDQRIYVVDINPTPWGPPAGLASPAAEQAVRAIAHALLKAIRLR